MRPPSLRREDERSVLLLRRSSWQRRWKRFEEGDGWVPSQPIEPTECLPVSQLPDTPGRLYEIKLDGYQLPASGRQDDSRCGQPGRVQQCLEFENEGHRVAERDRG